MSIRSSNFFKEMKTKGDILKKGKIIMEYLSLGSGTASAVIMLLTSTGLITVTAPVVLSISSGCILFALGYKLIPDSYVVLKKKISEMKDRDITEKELIELEEIRQIVNSKLSVISTASNNTPRTETTNTMRINYNNPLPY